MRGSMKLVPLIDEISEGVDKKQYQKGGSSLLSH